MEATATVMIVVMMEDTSVVVVMEIVALATLLPESLCTKLLTFCSCGFIMFFLSHLQF